MRRVAINATNNSKKLLPWKNLLRGGSSYTCSIDPFTTTTTSTAPNQSISNTFVKSRQFHFGSTDYSKTFRQLPKPNIEAIRKSSKEYLATFDPKIWYDDPVRKIKIYKFMCMSTLPSNLCFYSTFSPLFSLDHFPIEWRQTSPKRRQS